MDRGLGSGRWGGRVGRAGCCPAPHTPLIEYRAGVVVAGDDAAGAGQTQPSTLGRRPVAGERVARAKHAPEATTRRSGQCQAAAVFGDERSRRGSFRVAAGPRIAPAADIASSIPRTRPAHVHLHLGRTRHMGDGFWASLRARQARFGRAARPLAAPAPHLARGRSPTSIHALVMSVATPAHETAPSRRRAHVAASLARSSTTSNNPLTHAGAVDGDSLPSPS